MKKNYIAPVALIQSVEVEEMIAASIGMGKACAEGEIVTADGKARQDANNETWGNLW